MKIKVEYDPNTGNITHNGMLYFIGVGLRFEDSDNGSGNTVINAPESDVVKLSNNGMTSKDLISLRKAGVI